MRRLGGGEAEEVGVPIEVGQRLARLPQLQPERANFAGDGEGGGVGGESLAVGGSRAADTGQRLQRLDVVPVGGDVVDARQDPAEPPVFLDRFGDLLEVGQRHRRDVGLRGRRGGFLRGRGGGGLRRSDLRGGGLCGR